MYTRQSHLSAALAVIGAESKVEVKISFVSLLKILRLSLGQLIDAEAIRTRAVNKKFSKTSYRWSIASKSDILSALVI